MPRYLDAIADSLANAFLRWQQDGDNWFEVDLDLPHGVVQLAAELVLDPRSGTLALFDVAIYPLDDMIWWDPPPAHFVKPCAICDIWHGKMATAVYKSLANVYPKAPRHVPVTRFVLACDDMEAL
ncbi:hypothetical protein J2X54_001774 [Duganella sp. 3397]|uniref:hypothetical protein n=1 Tax=Duganella sp. 3397 TaxID=2817732 RepID=UPI002864C0F1|nr:hypothetical protein [Duganella sp. 3397]MDR7049319.1 hypothetical protein [Duganella sp. 3397]